jgi:hypothetical protein
LPLCHPGAKGDRVQGKSFATPSSGDTPQRPDCKKTGNASQKTGFDYQKAGNASQKTGFASKILEFRHKNLGIGGQNLSIGEKTLGLVEFLRAELTYISLYDARSEGTRRN